MVDCQHQFRLTPYNNPGLSVSVAPGNLPGGTYTGTVTITPTGGTAQTIGVTLTVTATAIVTATVQGATGGNNTTMALTYLVGGNSPAASFWSPPVVRRPVSPPQPAAARDGCRFLRDPGTTATSGTNNLTVSVVPTVLSSLLPESHALHRDHHGHGHPAGYWNHHY